MRAMPACLLVLCGMLAACADDGDGGGGATQGCEMHTVAEMQVLNDHGSPVVAVAVNGTKAAFVVDTGARASLMYEASADRLGLPADPDNVHLMTGIGGSVFTHSVTVDNLSLGTAIAHHVDFQSIPGGTERSIGGLPVVGLFGADFLVNYDVLFDLPAHMVVLYSEHHHCTDNLRPWPTGPYYRQPFQLENQTQITLDISVNGHKEPVILDSGAARTIIDSDAGNDGGASRATMTADRRFVARGIDGNAVDGHRHRFDSLDIGPEHFAPAFLDVADIEISGLLGADFLRARRVWVSYPHQVFYVQRALFPQAGTTATGGSASASGAPIH